jgi:hypothetical protein
MQILLLRFYEELKLRTVTWQNRLFNEFSETPNKSRPEGVFFTRGISHG